VHGAGFRDKNLFINYWGRIPGVLDDNGARIFYGNTDGWCSVENGAAALKATVEKVLAQTGSAKVNIVAHSKGGTEARYMISSLGMADKVASLTTIATPHHGSKTMDVFLAMPNLLLRAVAIPADIIRWFWGDKRPDFLKGIQSLGTGYMKEFNKNNPDKSGVYYQSYAAAMQSPMSDIIMSWPNYVIKSLDGENDGMVTVESAKWTNFRGVLRGAGSRGVSHLDEVDFRRSDVSIQKMDNGAETIRAFYVALLADLKQKGY